MDTDRTPDGHQERHGRSGPDTGDESGGEGAEFMMDATTGLPEDDVADADAGASYLKAQGRSPEDA
jgi:hypothetical protein